VTVVSRDGGWWRFDVVWVASGGFLGVLGRDSGSCCCAGGVDVGGLGWDGVGQGQ